MSQRRSLGFTLIELLVVLFIMGLLLAVATPAYERVLPGVELSAAARELAGALRAARTTALAEGRVVAVAFDVDAGVFRFNGEELSRALPSNAGIYVVAARSEFDANGVVRIRFFPDGASTGGRVTLTRGETSRIVDVNWLTGHVAILE